MNRISTSLFLLATSLTYVALAGDWPQILGPSRNGIAQNEQLMPWKQPPEIRWQYDCGSGFAGVAVVSGKVLLAHRVDDAELLDCLDADSGKRYWRANFPATYGGGYNPDAGPRCVPVVDAGIVYFYGAAGDLRAVRLADGKQLWAQALRDDLAAENGYFGAGSTPIVQGDSVVVAVGGADGSGIVGVDKTTGNFLWKQTDLEADYASPIAFDARSVVVPMRMQTVVLDSASGKIRHQLEFGQRGLNVIGATPIKLGEQLFLTASYRIGCKLFDFSGGSPEVKLEGDNTLSSQYTSPVVIDGVAYGTHGREDIGLAELRCVELSSGKVLWSQPDYGVAHLISDGMKLLSQNTEGRLELFATDSREFRSEATMQLPRGTYRAVPAISCGVLFCRASSKESGKLYVIKIAK